VIKYFETYVPRFLLPVIEKVAGDLTSYFPADYAAEMASIAPVLGLKLGDIVVLNLIYQIEGIGVNCSLANNTGPCPAKKGANHEPGLCTSIIARDSNGQIFHGRNLDWSIPAMLRQLMVDVEYQRNGSTLFIGSQPVGYMGILHAVKPNGWSFSLDARNHGGNVLSNLIWSLLQHSLTPTQHARQVMESASSYTEAVTALSTGSLVNPAYYIVGGMLPHEGAVVTRDRHHAVDIRTLSNTTARAGAEAEAEAGADGGAMGAGAAADLATGTSFFVLQTNYDHGTAPPSYDDRRTPGIAHMMALGLGGVGFEGVFSVLTEWPTFNHHTDFTATYSARDTSHYQTYLWPEWNSTRSNAPL
jgi:hypothetical protein